MFAGVPLPEIESEIERYGLFVRKFRHEISTTCTFLDKRLPFLLLA